jgi:ketosteroid isomerase-like protein
MSQDNVEVVRKMLLAASDGDPVAVLVWFDSASEWDLSGVTGWPEKRVYQGLQEIEAFVVAWANSFEEWHFDIEEVRDAGGERVYAAIHEWGIGLQSGARVDQYRYSVISMRHGRIVRIRMFSDRSAALRTADLGLEK